MIRVSIAAAALALVAATNPGAAQSYNYGYNSYNSYNTYRPSYGYRYGYRSYNTYRPSYSYNNYGYRRYGYGYRF